MYSVMWQLGQIVWSDVWLSGHVNSIFLYKYFHMLIWYPFLSLELSSHLFSILIIWVIFIIFSFLFFFLFLPRYCLGQVLHSLGQYEAASDCLQFAMDLESNSPIIPFTVIPRLLHWLVCYWEMSKWNVMLVQKDQLVSCCLCLLSTLLLLTTEVNHFLDTKPATTQTNRQTTYPS